MPRQFSLPTEQRGALTLRDAAAWLSISRDTLNDFIAQGEFRLVTKRTSKGTEIKLIPITELYAFMARNLDGANVAPIGRTRRSA